MKIDKHIFDGGLNSDAADNMVSPREYINMSDFRYGKTTDRGSTEILESVGGNMLIPNSKLPAGTNWCIGVASDYSKRRTVFFNWNSNGNHCIFCYDYIADTIYLLLTSSQVVGGLNFDQYHLIHSARVANGCVYWTDNLNEPRRIDINAAINLNQPGTIVNYAPYTAPMNEAVIAWIRRQPGLPPTWAKAFDNSPVNNILGEAFQFCYRYIYRNYEQSTLSGLSLLANVNAPTDPTNFINISIPFQEAIDQDVIQIDLVARYLTGGSYFIINSWQKSNPTDAAAIASHNAGSVQLAYAFYNRQLGIALDSTYTAKEFDSVPLLCQSIEVAKQRSFMGNIVLGYDTPQATSLNISLQNNIIDQVTGAWFFFQFQTVSGGNTNITSVYLFDVVNLPFGIPKGYYIAPGNSVPPFPASIQWTQLVFAGAGLFDVMNFYAPAGVNSILQFVDQHVSSIVLNPPVGPVNIVAPIMKSGSPYQGAINFFDNAGRKCGVVTNTILNNGTNNGLIIDIPDRTYATVQNTTGINWTLSNLNALVEIPTWAWYYSIDISANQRTIFFLQGKASTRTSAGGPANNNGLCYVGKDSSGNFTFTSTTYASNDVGIGVDITSLTSYGMGYVFSAGDIMKLYLNNGQVYTLAVVGQFAQWVIVQLASVGTLDAAQSAIYEIYTPFTPASTQPYYEVAQIYPINNPGSNARIYSVTAGTIPGDTYVMTRTDSALNQYLTEAMSPNDKYYKPWNTNNGRPDFIDTIGQQKQGASVAWSNTFIQDSKSNGLSTYDALDLIDISSDYGAIIKLQLTSKIQKTGTIMLAICDGGQTASLYLNEQTIQADSGETTIALAIDVIGTANELKGSYGTINPESVYEYKGNVYWLDIQQGKVVQYADNGLFAVSSYKMTRYWKLFSDQYKSMTQAAIAALGNRPFIPTCIDPHHEELLITVPKTLAVPSRGYLPDYPATPFPFDYWDGLGKTSTYKIYENPNKWGGSISANPDYMFEMEDDLFMFQNGNLYLANQSNYCNYFGTQVQPKVCIISNEMVSNVKSYNNHAVEANVAPVLAYFMALYPWLQASDLVTNSSVQNFKSREGIWYAPMFRNKLDPKYNYNFPVALIVGEKMRTAALYAMYQFDASAGIIQIKYLNLGYTLSLGQTV